jgi:hypothetical protein
MADKGSTEQSKKAKADTIKRNKDMKAIRAITEAIEAFNEGSMLKKDLLKAAGDESGISRRVLISVLDDYEGNCWSVSIGERNAKSYKLLNGHQATEKEYLDAKNGE